MINLFEVKETNEMIEKENLDVRTITLGISLMDCIDSNLDKLNRKIYDKITTTARNLVSVGEEIEGEFGIPIVNKRISVTPIALVGAAACRTPEDFVTIAQTLDRAAKEAARHRPPGTAGSPAPTRGRKSPGGGCGPRPFAPAGSP